MAEQLAIDALAVPDREKTDPVRKPLRPRQQLAFDYVRERTGVTADEVGAYLHSHKPRRPHPVDQRCDWCTRDGRSVLTSVALRPLVTYRNEDGQRVYVARDKADRAPKPLGPLREPTEAELAANPFAGLDE